MRSLLAVILLSAAGAAGAHALGAERGIYDQLGHSLSGAHHLPVLILLALVCLFALRGYLRRSR